MSLDPISLGVQVGRLRAVCDEMGAVLIRSAHSPNIKERRDCSTALFEPGGELVMQAEHIPVHLGSMPDAVAAIVDSEQRPGESWILNDPFRGGTHLPDITLITPVFCGDEARRLRRQPRAPRGRRRADAGLDAGQLAIAGGRRRCDRADPDQGLRRPRGDHRRDAKPPAAGGGPPCAAGRQRPRREPPRRPDRGRRPRGGLCRDAGDPRLLGAPYAGPARRRSATASGRPKTCSKEGPTARRTSRSGCARGSRATGSSSTSAAARTRWTATSTARSRSPARRRSSASASCSTPTRRPARAPIARSRSSRPRAPC